MVSTDSNSRFYSRGHAGKQPLRATEIRAAFLASDARGHRIARFRDERVGRLLARESPVPLIEARGVFVWHFVPVAATDPGFSVALPESPEVYPFLTPPGCDSVGFSRRYNLDGLLTYSHGDSTEPVFAYLQLFRNGAIEAVSVPGVHKGRDGGDELFPTFERESIDTLERAVGLFNALELAPPIFIMGSVLGVRGCRIDPNSWNRRRQHPIDREILVLPDVLMATCDESPASVLRPLNDAVWQAAGWSRSPSYDDEGRWSPKRR